MKPTLSGLFWLRGFISCMWLCAFYLRIWLALSLRGTLGSRDDQDDRPLQNYSQIFCKLYGVVLTFFSPS